MDEWDKCNEWVQAQLIAYNQIRDYEDAEQLQAMSGVSGVR